MTTLRAPALLLLAGLVLAPLERAQADDEILTLIDELAVAEQASGAVEKLIAKGEPAIRHLVGEAAEGTDLAKRGWAIVALAGIGGEEVKKELVVLQNNTTRPMLVRTWAAATRVKLARSIGEVSQLAGLVNSFPALGRPISIKLVAMSGDDRKQLSTMLLLTIRHRNLQKAMGKAILAKGVKPLMEAMITDPNQQVRRQAAAYLGSLAARGEKVAEAAIKALTFSPKAKKVPWENGPLFVPGIQWNRKQGTALVGQLLRWLLWAERHNRDDLRRQIHNNINSWSLARTVGYQMLGWRRRGGAQAVEWLQRWKKVVGLNGIRDILEEQGVQNVARYEILLR